jgi:hypothetical protein
MYNTFFTMFVQFMIDYTIWCLMAAMVFAWFSFWVAIAMYFISIVVWLIARLEGVDPTDVQNILGGYKAAKSWVIDAWNRGSKVVAKMSDGTVVRLRDIRG